jgi:transcriptional regulator with XRE-family HTH domain
MQSIAGRGPSFPMAKAANIRAVLAKNVRRLRLAKGLTQAALATDAGQHQGFISEVENGKTSPELDTVGKIAAALGVHPRELFEE